MALNLGARWRRVVSFTAQPHYPRVKIPRYLLDRRLGEPLSRSGRGGEVKYPCPYRESNPGRPSGNVLSTSIHINLLNV